MDIFGGPCCFPCSFFDRWRTVEDNSALGTVWCHTLSPLSIRLHYHELHEKRDCVSVHCSVPNPP